VFVCVFVLVRVEFVCNSGRVSTAYFVCTLTILMYIIGEGSCNFS